MSGGTWPWQAWLAVAGLAIPNVVLAVRGIWRAFIVSGESSFKLHERGWARASELEEEVRLLRIALHRQQARGSKSVTISEVLLLAMPLPLEDRIRAVKHAREIAESSVFGGADGESGK